MPSKNAPEDLNMKLRSKVNPSFIKHECLHFAVLKALYGFKEK